MEIKEKKKSPFLVLIDLFLNKGETASAELPKELEQQQKDMDSRSASFFNELQAPVKESSRKTKLDEELKVSASNRVKSSSKQRSTRTKSTDKDKELEQ